MPSLNTGNAILSNAIAVDSSYNVGIGGAASGTNKLQVTGIASANSFIPTSSTIPSNGMYLPSANTLGFATNGTLDMTLDTNGNLGLGVTPSAWATIKAMQILNTSYGASPNNLISYMSSNVFFDGAFKYITTGTATQYRMNDSGTFSWLQAPSGTAGNAISFTTAMTITSGGNVGIGTSSPDVPLEVYKSAGGPTLRITNSGTGTGSGNGFHIGSDVTAPFDVAFVQNENASQVFYTNSTERMRITSGGSVQITGNDSLLVLQAATVNKGIVVEYKNSAGTRRGYVGYGADSSSLFELSNNENGAISFRANGDERLRIASDGRLSLKRGGGTVNFDVFLSGGGDNFCDVDGQVFRTKAFLPLADNTYAIGSSGSRWTAVWAVNGSIQTSDKRQKKNIIKSDLGIDFINKLNPVKYNWIDGDAKIHYGLIAQEVESLNIDNFGALYIENDNYGLNYSEFIAPMIKAIQELKAEIEELKAIVATK